jgi:hypothetical protein
MGSSECGLKSLSVISVLSSELAERVVNKFLSFLPLHATREKQQKSYKLIDAYDNSFFCEGF